MARYKILVLLATIVPAVAFSLILWISPHVLTGGKPFDASIILSLLGAALSYYGLIFSSYAALQVQAIADVYFFKVRSPDIQRKLQQIARSVGDFGVEPSDDLQSQKFMSEAPVAFRSAKRVRNRHVTIIAEEAEASLRDLKESMKQSCGPGKSAGQIPNYWEFHQKVAELVDELGEQRKDARA